MRDLWAASEDGPLGAGDAWRFDDDRLTHREIRISSGKNGYHLSPRHIQLHPAETTMEVAGRLPPSTLWPWTPVR